MMKKPKISGITATAHDASGERGRLRVGPVRARVKRTPRAIGNLAATAQLHAVIKQAIPKASRDGVLKAFQLLRMKLHQLAAIDTDQVVVMPSPRVDRLIAGHPVLKPAFIQETCLNKQADGTIDGRITNTTRNAAYLLVDLIKSTVLIRTKGDIKDERPLAGGLQALAFTKVTPEPVLARFKAQASDPASASAGASASTSSAGASAATNSKIAMGAESPGRKPARTKRV